MSRFIAALAGSALVIALGVAASAEVKTITGEVIDVACHTKMGAKGTGADHANCATSCAKRGATLGILASDGVYTITGDMTADKNQKLVEFVARKVEAKGEVAEKDGAKTIDVASMTLAK
jgi:hypothetical protein